MRRGISDLSVVDIDKLPLGQFIRNASERCDGVSPTGNERRDALAMRSASIPCP
jgi:hypothetical protein